MKKNANIGQISCIIYIHFLLSLPSRHFELYHVDIITLQMFFSQNSVFSQCWLSSTHFNCSQLGNLKKKILCKFSSFLVALFLFRKKQSDLTCQIRTKKRTHSLELLHCCLNSWEPDQSLQTWCKGWWVCEVPSVPLHSVLHSARRLKLCLRHFCQPLCYKSWEQSDVEKKIAMTDYRLYSYIMTKTHRASAALTSITHWKEIWNNELKCQLRINK